LHDHHNAFDGLKYALKNDSVLYPFVVFRTYQEFQIIFQMILNFDFTLEKDACD
jgi:hypothetical protein